MIGIGAWYVWQRRRFGADGVFDSTRFLRAAVAAGPISVIALEAGWITTEVGRQPWIVYRVMRVEDAVTTNSGVWISLAVMIVVYTGMAIVASRVLLGMARRWREEPGTDLPTPYGPDSPLVRTGSDA